jgi:hypothetical protein
MRRARDDDVAAVRLMRTAEAADQGGLAGAVRAQQRMHGARPDGEVDALEHFDPAESLTQPPHLDRELLVEVRHVVPAALGRWFG